MSFSFIILILVVLAISLRQIFHLPLKIWEIMGLGACIMLFSGKISIISAWHFINWGIIGLFFGIAVIAQALEESGYLSQIASKFLKHGHTKPRLVAFIVFGLGILSAFLMNDAIAVLGTPVLLKIAHRKRISSHSLLLGMAFAITIGSVMSPIGNPQNLYITLDTPIEHPFKFFLIYLAIPTFLSLGILYFLVLKKVKTSEKVFETTTPDVYNLRLMIFCRIAFSVTLILIIINIIGDFFGFSYLIPLPYITLIPGCFLLIFSPKRREIFLKLDWQTLFFFIAMFILIKGVWESSPIKEILTNFSWILKTHWGIMLISILGSQLISNVPLVALYLPTIKAFALSTSFYMALAAGSTLAGNLLIFGAASNLIIIQSAEKRGEKGINFFEFAKYGIPLTVITFFIYWGYIALLS